MKRLIGRSCRVTINVKGKDLYYTITEILGVSDTHLTFEDKFNKIYSYRLQDVIEIQDVK